MTYLPIQLRTDIIYSSVFYPFVDIGINVRICGNGIAYPLCTVRGLFTFPRPDAARTDAEHDPPRTYAVNLFDKRIHVRTPPIVARHTVAVKVVSLTIVKRCRVRIRIKIIVKMYAVDIVIRDKFFDPVADKFSDFGQCGIEKTRILADAVFRP